MSFVVVVAAIVEYLLEQEKVGGACVPLIRFVEAFLEAYWKQVEIVLAMVEELSESLP